MPARTTQITFTDSIGAATLTNGHPFPANRFADWTPRTRPIGESAVAQGTGATTLFVFRTDFGVTLELRHISSVKVAGVAAADIADRLIVHLLKGGTCSVETGDVDANTYATCGLMPGTTPELRLEDTTMLEFALSLSLINLAGSPVRMLCRYAEQ